MTLENNAICAFAVAAPGTAEDEIRKFRRCSADRERQYFDALLRLYDCVREDFFAADSFAPS
jgi:hypothetical protein